MEPIMPVERWLRVAWMKLQSILRGRALDRDLDDELRDHLDRDVAARVARGQTAVAARRAALLAMGGIAQRREECRDARGFRLLRETGRDIRYALRTLRRTPAFTVVAIVVLALGIGANTAAFSVLHGVLFQPLPYPDADRLYMLTSTPGGPFGSGRGLADSAYLEFRKADQLFDDLATFGNASVNLTGAGEPLRVSGARVTPSLFSVLHTQPALGRVFTNDEVRPGRNLVVILSEAIWRSQFGANPAVLGMSVTLDGESHEVIGVLPAAGAFPATAKLWLPLDVGADLPNNSWTRPVVGRLKVGVSAEQALAELVAISGPGPNATATERARSQASVLPLKELIVGDVRAPLGILAGVVLLVLLIASANVANLMIVRTAARARELALRTSLGAGRGRVVRQLVIESTVLSILGGAAGVLLAYWGLPALLSLAPAGVLPRTELIGMDTTVLVFTFGLSLLTGPLFGLVPAIHATRPDRPLVESARTFTAGQERLRSALVVTEIALALVLLTGAGLMLKTLLRLGAVDPGFRAEGRVAVTIELPAATYRNVERVRTFHDETLARLTDVTGVERAAAVNWLPFGTGLIRGDFAIDGGRPMPREYVADKLAVSPGYFAAMSITLRQGRDFVAADHATAPGVVIVSRSLARDLWPGESPLGQRLAIDSPARSWSSVIGVVDDVKQQGLDGAANPAIYQPYTQVTRAGWLSHMSFVLLASARPPALVAAMREAVRRVDPDLPILSIAWLDDRIDTWSAQRRFQARLIGLFAAMALLLALAGVYGVLSYIVSQRTREIAIRMALGAARVDVGRLVLTRTLILAGLGIAIGAAGAAGLTRLLRQALFEVTPTDPATFGLVALIVAATALAAGAVPAWRATRVNPIVALHAD